MMRSSTATLFACASLGLTLLGGAAEITSNGLGGGRWSEAATWRGGVVPTSADDAVIAARDTVVFDRNDTEAPTCKQLVLDPNSNLAFQPGLGKRTLTVDGPIEVFGSLKMHAAGAADEMEIRLSSTVAAERAIKLGRGGALLVLGRPDLPQGKYNAAITVSAPPVNKVPAAAALTAGPRTAVDLQNARVENVVISAANIDNTGAKPNERCHFSGNRFAGTTTLALNACDTPVILKNEFEAQKGSMVRPAAITVGSCPLADIRGNRLHGPYAIGISALASECNVSDNIVEDCPQGIHLHTGVVMLKHNTLRNCKTALNLRTTTGSAEETFIDGGDLPVSTASAKVQLTSVVITNPPPGPLMENTRSSVTLLNCNILPQQIKSVRDDTLPRSIDDSDPAVDTMAFLVVRLKGTVPPRTHVELVTSNPGTSRAPGAADLNIRNSPAPVRADGLTPLPQSLVPLIVKSWRLDEENRVVPAPEYTLNVLAPAEAGAKPRVVKSLKLKPDEKWFRERPNEPVATVEVSLP